MFLPDNIQDLAIQPLHCRLNMCLLKYEQKMYLAAILYGLILTEKLQWQ